MCDLIDLSSPNVKRTMELVMPSPLIPAPKNVECDSGAGSETESAMGRQVEGNDNPFDQVLHETAEYVSKKGDPFEVMLQRALKFKGCRNARSVNFTDDYTPRKKGYFKAMNKTSGMLDESLLDCSRFVLFESGRDRKSESVSCDSKGVDHASVFKQEHKISGPDSLELSILNQSAMNDTLLEVIPKENDRLSPSLSSPLEKDALFKEDIFFSSNNYLKLNIQRSLSQGAGKSPTGLPYPYRRSQSVTDGQRKASLASSGTSTVSFLDKGFLESRQSDQSVFSSLSNVSSITKLTSASLSSVLSIDPMNRAFVGDGSSLKNQERMSITENSADIQPRRYDLSDLLEKFNKLKGTMNDTQNILNVTENDTSSYESNDQTTDNKLIDVDIFVPELNINFNKSSSSTCSSDSVFTNNKVNKSILKEAKVLAKTFEELNSGSSIDDDFISNNTLWMSELLPAFDEPAVDNLIHLPSSPEEYSRDRSNDKKQSPASIDSTEKNSLKELSFTSVSVVKQDITLLLLDLRKLVKPESNPEAKKLLDNLEDILNVNYKNNTELLAACLNASNKSQSLQKTSSDSIEKFDKSSTDKSLKEEKNKISQEMICNNEKSLSDVNYKDLEDTSQNISEKSSITACKNNDETRKNITDSSDLSEDSKSKEYEVKERDSQVDKKIAVELLVNLKKLLSGQFEDDTTIQLLKNIGKVLNIALNNPESGMQTDCTRKQNIVLNNPESEMETDCTRKQNIQQTTPVRARKSDSNVHSSALSTKVTHRRSLELKSKTVRKSISAIESSPKSTQIRTRRDSSNLENRQKRFSSDPGFTSNVSNKKPVIPEACNTRKSKLYTTEVAKSECGKEKSIGLNDVKNKLKKRSDIINKKGPIRAVHPVDNMQKNRASIGRKMSSQIITPPKSNKITPLGNKIVSSTPTDNNYYMPKKSAKSKPIASSTPDSQNNKNAPLTASVNKKRNLSCDISPVTTYVNMSSSDERKDSPRRSTSKLPTPKKCTTPTRQHTDALGIPKFLTPPRHYSSCNTNNHSRSPRRLNRSAIGLQRYSPVSEKKDIGRIQQSPLKETNRISAKVKPLNLISKIKRHSISDFTEEKENNYA
ncbi:uncharacterized protein LOC105838594 [Monomorium pharaonis]|uniref:uncharacterized protein LOC105838594 n=1 Tax=Monomorium pharaonis TaxID=307658 RepID=UPI00063F9211|nr:uncharacterized protein LOC105838594 [Monomorium pharaonis]XP_036148120.1 uncharacterized protein LOC105838594 [Monomorium pharaonis]